MKMICWLGIKIGEIGSKLGINSANNGYLAFNNVRIPRMNMLMKNSKVHKVSLRCEVRLYGWIAKNLFLHNFF